MSTTGLVSANKLNIPQFPILFDDEDKPWAEVRGRKVAWSTYADFLAIKFAEPRKAQIIEVSKSMSPDKPKDMVKRTLACREKVERYVRWFTAEQLDIQWRFFVRQSQ
jgi:hypothetical protein